MTVQNSVTGSLSVTDCGYGVDFELDCKLGHSLDSLGAGLAWLLLLESDETVAQKVLVSLDWPELIQTVCKVVFVLGLSSIVIDHHHIVAAVAYNFLDFSPRYFYIGSVVEMTVWGCGDL